MTTAELAVTMLRKKLMGQAMRSWLFAACLPLLPAAASTRPSSEASDVLGKALEVVAQDFRLTDGTCIAATFLPSASGKSRRSYGPDPWQDITGAAAEVGPERWRPRDARAGLLGFARSHSFKVVAADSRASRRCRNTVHVELPRGSSSLFTLRVINAFGNAGHARSYVFRQTSARLEIVARSNELLIVS